MAVHICSQCGHSEHVFGVDGGRNMAQQLEIDYLGALPLDIKIRLQADSGKPTVVADPSGDVAQIYQAMARQVAIKIAAKARDFSSVFPSIKISKET
jgi:ATP-binding protein involved in chromosome partitioning